MFKRILSIILVACNCGCMERVAIRMAIPFMEKTVSTLSEEEDLELAKGAAAANLNLLESSIKTDPKNSKLLLMGCKAFTGYALAFVSEDEPERARRFFERAMKYGLNCLKNDRRLVDIRKLELEKLNLILKRYKKRDVSKLFWPALAWGFWINHSRDKPAALAELPRVEAIMARVQALDESYFYGGPHLFFAVLYGSRTRMLGGDPEKAKKHFEENIRINHGQFLLTRYFYAQTVAIQTQDKKLFEKLLNEIIDAPPNLLPEQRMLNQAARKKAEDLLYSGDDYF